MKTIIWKELRENIKWAALAMLCLLLAELGTLHQQRDRVSHGFSDLTIGGSAFLLVSAFGCAIIGLVIGALQILPELRRDQWAALLHRPVTRRTIFFGKVIAGLLLYFFATALPLAASVACAATPGQFAGPLVPGMIRPPASDLFLGMACYFAALLLSLSRGPWYGKRGLLALYVLPVLFCDLFSPWPFLVTIGASLIAMAAACGAMTSNGPIKGRPAAGRLAFVFLLLAAVETALGLLLAGLCLLPGAVDKANYSYRHFELTHDGQIFVESNKEDGSPRVLTKMDGTPVTDERYLGNNSNQALLSDFIPLVQNMKYDLADEVKLLARHPRWLANYVRITDENSPYGAEIWYAIVGKNYFVGYDKISRRRIGICDRDGFHSSEEAPKPFLVPLQGSSWNYGLPHLYVSGAQLYGFNFAERRLTPLFNAGNGTIYDAAGFSPTYHDGETTYIGVALKKEIQIVDPKANPVVKFPYGHDPSGWTEVELATIPSVDRIFVEYEPQSRGATAGPGMASQPSFVDEVDLHGEVVHTYSTVFPRPVISVGWLDRVSIGTLPFVPSAVFVAWARLSKSAVSSDIFTGQVWFQNPLTCLLVLFGIGIALAIVTLWWARRVGLPAASARRWAVFVFCLGLPGFITFRLAADWPTWVPCPKCGRQRSIAGEECPECHQAWPIPESNGTEIFQPAGS